MENTIFYLVTNTISKNLFKRGHREIVSFNIGVYDKTDGVFFTSVENATKYCNEILQYQKGDYFYLISKVSVDKNSIAHGLNASMGRWTDSVRGTVLESFEYKPVSLASYSEEVIT